ncbi:MAG: glycoside hydrolase family 92 protein [Clostridiales bacterium]|nr:glycoside hydrolase family 92 protein [Clostridiales bacterium]
MKKRSIDCINIFQGTRGSTIPKEGSLYSQWNLLKGKAGNTSPAACLPFGSVACSPYSGGYSSGYGNFMRNGGEIPESFFEGNKLIGFSHFTHSGSGAFGFYYNYLVTVPFKGELVDIHNLKEVDSEKASVGYYSCRLMKDNIKAEMTVADKVAIHRYTSLDGKPFKIGIDISNDGLKQSYDEKVFSYAQESEVRIEENQVVGYIVVQGIKLYYCIAGTSSSALWFDKKVISEREIHIAKTEKAFGCLFETDSDCAIVKVGYSLVSVEKARAAVSSVFDFDIVREQAENAWFKRLSTIELEGVSDEDREIFYSNYYHTLIKPCGWKNESFLWDEKETFYLDFATLWDVYKTQIPLIFTLHADIGKGIVKTLLRYGKTKGKLFNALMLSANMNIESTQACCLGCYVLYDAYIRGLVEEQDVDDMFAVVKSEIEQYAQSIKDGSYEKTTKLLDCTLIAESFAGVAKELNRMQDYEYLSDIAKYWICAFGKDGLLKTDYPYYEGNHWNYSFRFVNDVEKRIELSGGKENLIKQLDAFFAFSDGTERCNRFEGFNNETDMGTPYFYHYVDRYDRLAEIMQECTKNCFRAGRDGLPGNNDSGGLSACYMWNFLGLFPISGQDIMFLGVPKAKKAVLHLSNGKILTIISNLVEKHVKEVVFNEKRIDNYKLSIQEILNGGEIIFS